MKVQSMSAALHTGKAASSASGYRPVVSPLLQRKCACGGGSSGLTGSCSECEKKRLHGQPLQTKLRINDPGDQYEQEADRVAEQVMRMPEENFKSSERQPFATVQRRVAGDEFSSGQQPMLQRAEGAGGQTPAEPAQQAGETPSQQEEGSRCPSWRNDPESISKRAAETYVQNDITPPSQATVEKIDCEPPIANGNYGCYVHFSDGLVVRVIVREKDIVVGMGPGPITTLTPPPATPLCFYDYACPDGHLVLTVIECKSAKPAAPSGPTLVGQRRATPGASGVMDAGSAVSHVLATPGQSLDRATNKFFSARFGHDFANVRIHADAEAAESARAVNALAYTVGRDVVFAAGQYAPNTGAGQQLLAHELTHVVQQGGADPRVLASSFLPSGTVSSVTSVSGLVQREPAESAGGCDDMVFCTHLNLPFPMKDRYFVDGDETKESSHNARIASESTAGKCNINLNQELPLNLGPLNPGVTVNFFYRGEPCCPCFRGNLSWNVAVNGNPQTGLQGVRAGSECSSEKCCDVKKSLPVSITVSLGATFTVNGTILLDGSSYRQTP
jgi:hypothetical protein